ncbi:unnamed protein product [Polarella glacialis]|uniref:Uncharacterized protein n=1 Tax=Polarella glacialis TaxID=89957 RepID=A0A813LCN7_POLGL|nr:unnamed protein product [Polarella glacialis]CAE8721308.1 unnamed protein product [Polarella glacialis]
MTRGFVRSPPPPFAKANSPWNPPEADPNSPAGQLQSTMAKNGAFWDGSHQHLGKSRSSPQLQHSGENVMACHPLSAELRRWERLAAVTERGEVNKDIQLATMSGKMSESVEEEKPRGRVGGLVNFPKYMLINNCHLKTTDLGRFQREQVELQRQADETAARGDTSSEVTWLLINPISNNKNNNSNNKNNKNNNSNSNNNNNNNYNNNYNNSNETSLV